jgi:hypothetical protein
LSLFDECYSGITPCALNLISTFLLPNILEVQFQNCIAYVEWNSWKYPRREKSIFIRKFEDTKWIIRSDKSKKDIKYNGKKKKDNDLQNLTPKTKDRATRTSLKPAGERRYSGRVSSSCSTSGTRRFNLVTNPDISHKRGKDRIVIITNRTCPWSFVTQIFRNG